MTAARTMSALAALMLVLQLAACALEPIQDPDPASVSVRLSRAGDNQWRAAYRLTHPRTALLLVRTTSDARSHRWQMTSSDFELVHSNRRDVIRRTDGAAFSSVDVLVSASYEPLPKEYAPISPFSDGGLLIYSGRFQACATDAPQTDELCGGPWAMQIEAPPGAKLILHGQRYARTAEWLDADSGTMVYVGNATPIESEHVIGVIDSALPDATTSLMAELLPRLFDLNTEKLPPLPQRPMLFMSYDPEHGPGHGRQGSTLPNQIFAHIYGRGWDDSTAVGSSPEDTAWFFAHEVGHLFQHDVAGEHESAWIHEGAAEAFAYRALETLDAASADYLDSREEGALERCAAGLGTGTLTSAAERGRFSDYYDCGFLMFLAIDAAIRARSDGRQDLYSYWSALIDDQVGAGLRTSVSFLGHAEATIGEPLTDKLLMLVGDELDDPARFLSQLATESVNSFD